MTVAQEPPDFRMLVDGALTAFVADRRRRLADLGDDLTPLIDAAEEFVEGGKRLRPAFFIAGWRVAGGGVPTPAVVEAAAALEWLQASALVHDDLMDGSDTRRGRPSVHRAFEAHHRATGATGAAEGFGLSAAVLLGDLMLSWCDEMLGRAIDADPALSARSAAVRRILDDCKSEVVSGQFLDVVSQTRATITAAEAMRVVTYKSAKYTVERPLHLGAALAGADDATLDALSAVALPLGAAFQLRDDLLGVFGDPVHTGKPAGDDIREGKRTLLVALTADLTDDAGRALLTSGLGTAGGIESVSALMESSGARAAVEAEIDRLTTAAETAIDALGGDAREILDPLVSSATRRTK